ncbi:MAG: hypothetical protein R6W82_05440 [bacterium]
MPEEPAPPAEAQREELRLLVQVYSDLQTIGGEADRIAEQYPEGDPRKRESDRIRREVAALKRYIAEAVI